MKKLLMIGGLIALRLALRMKSAVLNYSAMPDELKDCKVFYLSREFSNGDKGPGELTVMRCPLSATTTSYVSNKTNVSNVVIDGQVYVPASSASGPAK